MVEHLQSAAAMGYEPLTWPSALAQVPRDAACIVVEADAWLVRKCRWLPDYP